MKQKQITVRLNEINLKALNELKTGSNIKISYNQLINTILTSKLKDGLQLQDLLG